METALTKFGTCERIVAAAVTSIVPGSSTLFAGLMFSGCIESQLQRDGIEFGVCAAFTGDCFLVATLTVKDPKPALGSLFKLLENQKPFNCYPREIAYYDSDEAFWRTVHPKGAPPFDRFLTPELIRMNEQKAAEHTAFLQRLRNAVTGEQAPI